MKHHIVQDKYLAQWKKDNTTNRLNIYFISSNKIQTNGNTKTPVFWREDFNILKDENDKSYLPENVTAIIDTKGIGAIKNIDVKNKSTLTGEYRSYISFYVVLQYLRTPRYREETDKMVNKTTQFFMRKDIDSANKVSLSKETLLKEIPKNDKDREAIKKIKSMTEKEINEEVFNLIHSEYFGVKLNTSGHSKILLKVDKFAKEFFTIQWTFLVAPKGTSFVTSDNPCFTISPTKLMNGLLSPNSTVVFPLRPDVCIYAKPKIKTQIEQFVRLDKSQVRDINKLILSNSYDCIVAKDETQLKNITKNFDYKNHRKSRDVSVSEVGDYVMFNIE